MTLPLLYSELIAPDRNHKQILLPNEIPLHPAVFRADFAYTPDFVEEVHREVPNSIRHDISEIERILGISTEVVVTKNVVASSQGGCEYKWDWFQCRVNSDRKYVEVVCGGSNIGMNFDEESRIVRKVYPLQRHPMSPERLREYAFSPQNDEHNLFWYIHNISDGIIPLQLYFRNFAILFNNLGLSKLR